MASNLGSITPGGLRHKLNILCLGPSLEFLIQDIWRGEGGAEPGLMFWRASQAILMGITFDLGASGVSHLAFKHL